MARKKRPTPQDLTNSREPRVAARLLDRQQRFVALLRQARHLGIVSEYHPALDTAITEAEAELQRLRLSAGGRIVPRRRPSKTSAPTNTCTVYLDECGQYSLTAKDPFGAFVLGAVILRDDDEPRIDRQWKAWKQTELGTANKIIHEPDLRYGIGPFWFHHNLQRQSEVRDSLHKLLTELDFKAIACVIHRGQYVKEVGTQPLDVSLPTHPYLMTLDFLMERLVMILDQQFGGARAHVVAEARGPLEDALLQAEYVRLLIEGTTYVAATWFRQALTPGIEFRTKQDNITGLQLADLLVRPCGEKVLNPTDGPIRWPIFREKLCQGQETAHSILGFKIVPWDEKYNGIWAS